MNRGEMACPNTHRGWWCVCIAASLACAACGDDDTVPAEDMRVVLDGRVTDFGGIDAPPVDGGGGGLFEGEVFETRGRLSVAAAASGEVIVIDLDTEEVVRTYELEAPALLRAADSRQITAVVAAQPDADRFDVFGVGVWVWDHEDHFHVYKASTVFQVDDELSYTGPVDGLVSSGGWMLAATPTSVGLLLERSIGSMRTDIDRSRAPIFRTQEAGAQDGVAAVARGHLLYASEDGLRIRPPGSADFGEEEAPSVSCDAPSALAGASGGWVASCGEQLVAARWDEDADAFVAVDFSAELPSASAIVTFGASLFGAYRDGSLTLLDVASAEANTLDFEGTIEGAWLNRSGEAFWVRTDAGIEHVDLATLEVSGRWAGASAGFAPGDGFGYAIVDGAVVEIDEATMTPSRTIEVPFEPGSLIVTAMWPGGAAVMH